MISDDKFKIDYRSSSCNNRPWEYLIPKDIRFSVMAKVKQECLQIYGRDFNECSKRKICFSKKCLGRELEWKSPTALPYLKIFASIVGIKEGEDYYIQTECSTCPIFKTCTSICAQINDFLTRDKSQEPELIYKETLDNFISEDRSDDKITSILGKGLKIPWDVLTKKRQQTVQKYLYEQKDFLTIAQELKFHDQSRARYEFYAALTKLSKYAVIRDFIEKNANTGTFQHRQFAILNDVFFINKSITEAAYTHGVTKQAIQQMISKLVKTHNLKWNTFVRKEGNKIIYQVPELFK